MKSKHGKSVAFHTLGCKVNQYDTQAMQEKFIQNGYNITEFDQIADVYVINTCTVTSLGDRKSRQMIRRANRLNPNAVIAVVGCYAQTAAKEILNIPGVDLVLGTRDRNDIVQLVEKARNMRRCPSLPMKIRPGLYSRFRRGVIGIAHIVSYPMPEVL